MEPTEMKPTIALFTTSTQAVLVSAAITRMIGDLQARSQDPEITAACEQLSAFEQHLIEQVQAPIEPSPTAADILATLTRMNQAARRARLLPLESEASHHQEQIIAACYRQLVCGWCLPIHRQDGIWQLGDPLTPARRKLQREQAAWQIAQRLREEGERA